MAFKMKNKLTKNGLINLNSSPFKVIDPITGEKPKLPEGKYEEINRTTSTRRGVQNNVPGTFTDINITERADFDAEIPSATPGTKTTDTQVYLENLKKRFPGVPGSVLVREGYIDPSFEDQFPLDYDQRNRLETTFVPDPTQQQPEQNTPNYENWAIQTTYGGGFGASRQTGYANSMANAYRALANLEDRNWGEGYVRGLINKEDYEMGKNFGSGYAIQDFKNTERNLREKYHPKNTGVGLSYNKQYKAELEQAKELLRQRRLMARQGKWYSPEAEERYKNSYNIIADRSFNKGDYFKPEGERSILTKGEGAQELLDYGKSKKIPRYYRF